MMMIKDVCVNAQAPVQCVSKLHPSPPPSTRAAHNAGYVVVYDNTPFLSIMAEEASSAQTGTVPLNPTRNDAAVKCESHNDNVHRRSFPALFRPLPSASCSLHSFIQSFNRQWQRPTKS
jgi:hypothetical protein